MILHFTITVFFCNVSAKGLCGWLWDVVGRFIVFCGPSSTQSLIIQSSSVLNYRLVRFQTTASLACTEINLVENYLGISDLQYKFATGPVAFAIRPDHIDIPGP